MYFTQSPDGQASYYTGVSDVAEAATIHISAGETENDIRFIVPPLNTYSVRGLVFTDEMLASPNGVYTVSLILVNPGKFPSRSNQSIICKDKPGAASSFDFENVPPGHYIAHISRVGEGWFERKVEFTVDDHNEFITLNLLHKK